MPAYENIVNQHTPYEIAINGSLDSIYVEYEITVTMDSNYSSENQQIHTFIVEDNIMSVWWIFDDVNHNARNVVRIIDFIEDINIDQAGESQTLPAVLRLIIMHGTQIVSKLFLLCKTAPHQKFFRLIK